MDRFRWASLGSSGSCYILLYFFYFVATVYGDGVYFAIHAKYSCQNTYSKPDSNGTKRMYLCKVLTGEYAKGERGMRVPPQNVKRGPHALYNSVTNDLNNPHMFIIFHDTQACPEYLIYFKEP